MEGTVRVPAGSRWHTHIKRSQDRSVCRGVRGSRETVRGSSETQSWGKVSCFFNPSIPEALEDRTVMKALRETCEESVSAGATVAWSCQGTQLGLGDSLSSLSSPPGRASHWPTQQRGRGREATGVVPPGPPAGRKDEGSRVVGGARLQGQMAAT